MVGLGDLLVPILVSGIAVFFASSVIWMALPYHKKDIQFLPNEEELTKTVSSMDITPGFYMFPNCADAQDMKSEEFKAKWNSGPWGTINVMGSKPNFGMNLIKCFVTYLVISAMAGYLAGIGTAPGADYMDVFRAVGTAALLGHCMGGLGESFFQGKPSRYICTSFFDGVVYALVTAGVFAAMWPGVAESVTP